MTARPIAYRGHDPYIFISYAHADSQRVYPLLQGLQSRGLRVWYDEGLEVGSHWDEAISQHLSGCTCVICFVTTAFLMSENCLDEIHFAKELGKDPMIVYLDDLTLPLPFQFRYGRLHALRLSQSGSVDMLLEELSRSEALQRCRGSAHAAGHTSRATNTDPIVRETISTMSPAAIYSSARHLHQQNNLALAFTQYKQAANMGHAEAQFYLGHCYFCGEGTEVDYAQASKWFHQALDNGCEDAVDALEELYQENGYLSDDEDGIAQWYKIAAAAGDHRAQGAYGVYLWDSFPFYEPDEDRNLWEKQYRHQRTDALDWMEQAVTGGVRADLALRLARCYELGMLVPRSLSKAQEYYQIAAQNPEDPEGQTHLDNFLLRRSGGITTEAAYRKGLSFIAGGSFTNTDQEEAAAWFHMAAGRGHRSAMRELGIIYYTYTGPNLTKSFGLAHYYLSEAAKGQTDPESMFALANYQKESYFSKRDPQGLEKAKEWYQRAADMGHAGAKTALEKL